ncbi:ash family protein [Salmonella enterica subsp. diarizonae]|nr:ash family protein [Salmonella enterica subsp. diarizonae]
MLSRKVLSGEHLTSTRKVKAALVKRPVSFVIVVVNFHTIIVCTKNKFVNYLPLRATSCYRFPAPHKTGAGCRNPKLTKATPDAESVFFVVRYTRHSMAWCATMQRSYNRRSAVFLSHHAAHNGTICGCCVRLRPAIDAQNRISRRPIMVTLAGQPQGWPVSFVPGIPTPVNVTAPIECRNSSGDSLNQNKGGRYHG